MKIFTFSFYANNIALILEWLQFSIYSCFCLLRAIHNSHFHLNEMIYLSFQVFPAPLLLIITCFLPSPLIIQANIKEKKFSILACNFPNSSLSIIFQKILKHPLGFPGGAVVENLPANAVDMGSNPGLGRSHMPQSN